MTRPVLVAPYFAAGSGDPYERLARVLRYTAACHCGTWTRAIRAIEPRPVGPAAAADAFRANVQQLDAWCHAVRAVPADTPVALFDADTAILRPLDDIWARPFDVAYTVKVGHRFPFNTGVLFLRTSARVVAFLESWLAIAREMLELPGEHRPYRRRFGGIQQAALGAAFERDLARQTGVTFLPIPCAEWNCEDATWDAFDPAVTRVVHIKSALRSRILHHDAGPFTPAVVALAAHWLALEQRALAAHA